jgi:hypothetical protein
MQPFEKLGAFYLGKLFDPDGGKVRDDLLLYDAKDLTTHAVCVGMTGSGKTGLCVSLLEEAAIDGIPTIAIDPKGDLGNLSLTFPDLRPADFRPWVDEAEAARKGQTADEYAASVANLWTRGLGQWGQDGSRIARFKDAADVAIYTPGSSAGLPLRVLRSFDAPPAALIDDSDAFRERVASTVSGLLALLGIDADPIRSREHILLSNILHRAWEQGRGLDLGALIREIQSPPFDRIGVMDLDSFYPSKERFELSMALNNLLASPGFSAWMEGEPLSIPRLLWTEKGKPRISILSIAHLSDTERMFFVTLLLNEVVAWMRTQPGTPSLRALLYMDEVFGYFPPTANPPSKIPMLTLLKQARAFGLGVVLATQNPVDLDYKGLSNAGTWLLGRLQTERDKARVLDGLEGASAAGGGVFDRHRTEAILSGLGSRVFLMNNVHDDEPSLFHTRWAMSYLRGPLTRTQIRALMAGREAPAAPAASPGEAIAARQAAAPKAPAPKAAAPESERPVVPPEVPEHFLPREGSIAADDGLVYRPALLGSAKLHFVRAREEVDKWEEATLLAPLDDETLHAPWDDAAPLEEEPDLDSAPETDARFSELPAEAARAKSYPRWGKKLADHLYRNRKVTLWKCPELRTISTPGESEGEFRARLTQLVREKRDLKIAKLQKRYTPKLARLGERIRKAEAKVGREQSQYGQQKMQTAISMGATVLGALFGRKVASVGTVGRATTTMRGVGRAARERGDIKRALEDLEARKRELADLEAQFEEEVATVRDSADAESLELKTVDIRPRKSDTSLGRIALVWTPWRVGKDGIAEPIFR